MHHLFVSTTCGHCLAKVTEYAVFDFMLFPIICICTQPNLTDIFIINIYHRESSPCAPA